MKKQNAQEKLVLFDIDGTLVGGHKAGPVVWHNRIRNVFKHVFSVDDFELPDLTVVNGLPHVALLKHVAGYNAISEADLFKKLDDLNRVYADMFDQEMLGKGMGYATIESAKQFVEGLRKQQHLQLGVISGNVQRVGWKKLEVSGYDGYFSFGVFGDYFSKREDMANSIFELTPLYLGKKFDPKNIVLVGDTKFDIRAAKHIGAKSIAVATGETDTIDDLLKENPDLAVESLLDPAVCALL